MIFSMSGIVDSNYPMQGIQDLKRADIDGCMLDLGMLININELQSFQVYKEKIIKSFDTIYKKMQQAQIRIKAIRIPDIDYYEPLKKCMSYIEFERLRIEIASESIKICERIECRNVIVSPIISEENNCGLLKENIKFYTKLLSFCDKKDTKIFISNKGKVNNGHYVRSFFSDANKVKEFIEILNFNSESERFGFLLDTGYCNLCGQNMNEFIKNLESCLKIVIIRDNNGRDDFSALPFTNISLNQSNTDWLGLVRGLRNIEYKGMFILDFSSTARCFSPLLRPNLISMAKSIGEYFEWQIGIEQMLKKYSSIVLFGAGNMCKNFMNCFGDRYKPLFTCDNNIKLWGTKCSSLEVKSPEALKSLPNDCGVFICNIYYREIEAQLKEIGVKNIEFFSDEFIPSLYII